MFNRTLVLGGLSGLLLLCGPSCSSDKKCEGGETCACYKNGTCDAGLDCRSNVCVSLSASSAGSTGSSFDTKACLACAESSCASEASACKASSGCETLLNCLLGCTTDATCLTNCAKGVTPDNLSKEGTYQVCALSKCTSDCTYTPSIPVGLGGMGGSGNGSAGQSSSAGGSSKAGSSSTSGGSSNVGGSTGVAGSPPVSAVNWLSLVGDAAPSSDAVNGQLGIEGVFYAYADPCSTDTLLWDPITRCISGTICAQDSQGANWGAAIGFDFNNQEDVKHAWSATAAGVTGIAWSAVGSSVSSGALQIWVQNMDPSFSGVCSAMNCNINAPPDGRSSVLPSGEFTFASMMKEVWGPGASSYVFNPANISSLQFKLSAKASITALDLCIDGVGVLR